MGEIKTILEIAAICAVSALMVIFASLYFIGTKRQKKLKASAKNLYSYDSVKDLNENQKVNADGDITADLVEQIRIINAQLDLMFELSAVFIVCYDYGRNYFYISENGWVQLGYNPQDEQNETDQKKFESLIHEDYITLYEEVTNFEDIRKHQIADSPYIIKIKNANTNQYSEYLMKAKPIYDEDWINKALVAAFINTEYISKQNKIKYNHSIILTELHKIVKKNLI